MSTTTPQQSPSKNDKSTKKNWEFGRFLKTGTFYNAFQPQIIKRLFNPVKSAQLFKPNQIIWSNQETNDISWGPLDDVVMGGVSKSDINPGDQFNGSWTGFVTSANNGGFAGIRTKSFNPPKDLSSSRGIVVKVRGDGNRYKFIARDNDEWNGIAWSYSFDTQTGKSTEIKIPFSGLLPTKYARTVDGSALFDSKSLRAIQFSLSKFEYNGGLNPKFKEGDFNLNIESIRTF
eukprot:gene21035-27261_t